MFVFTHIHSMYVYLCVCLIILCIVVCSLICLSRDVNVSIDDAGGIVANNVGCDSEHLILLLAIFSSLFVSYLYIIDPLVTCLQVTLIDCTCINATKAKMFITLTAAVSILPFTVFL